MTTFHLTGKWYNPPTNHLFSKIVSLALSPVLLIIHVIASCAFVSIRAHVRKLFTAAQPTTNFLGVVHLSSVASGHLNSVFQRNAEKEL